MAKVEIATALAIALLSKIKSASPLLARRCGEGGTILSTRSEMIWIPWSSLLFCLIFAEKLSNICLAFLNTPVNIATTVCLGSVLCLGWKIEEENNS